MRAVTLVGVERLLQESSFFGTRDGEGDLQDLRLAILLEDTYGVTLTDDQISGLHLLDLASLTDLLESGRNA